MYRRGGWRHAPHDGGDGGDDKEENSFSNSRHRHLHQGKAAIHRHGFLYLLHHPHRRNQSGETHDKTHTISSNSEPPSAATAFCIYSITLIDAIKVEKPMIDPIQSAATKSRRSPARRREKWKGKYHRLAPPSHYIHPQANHPQPYSTLPHRHLHQAESPPTSR